MSIFGRRFNTTYWSPDGVQHFRNLQPLGPEPPQGRRIEVELHGYGEQGRILRAVTVPPDDARATGADEALLDLVWEYGQNEVQPVPDCRSLCIGDVVRHPNGTRHVVRGQGFALLPPGAPPDAGADRLTRRALRDGRAIYAARIARANEPEADAAQREARDEAVRLMYIVEQTGLSTDTIRTVEEAAMRFEDMDMEAEGAG